LFGRDRGKRQRDSAANKNLEQSREAQLVYIIKEFIQPKINLNNREFLIWKERRERERGAGRLVSRQAYIRLG
jgi:hypothetical protein